MNKLYKADLHLHSSHSNKPSAWALRKINCPESYTSPQFIYQTVKKIGMDYVTITDHNTINGALEIAHLPGTFISSEITTRFPEDRCPVHVVVLNITEKDFGDIMKAANNIYELVAYLRAKGIVHFIAHPLYDEDERITASHIEKMILLFEVFEVKNGARAMRYNRLTEDILSALTRDTINALSDKHGIEPYGATAWIKAMVGGSDDHSGSFLGSAYTVSPTGKTIEDFIVSIQEKKTWAEGEDGDSLLLAHSLYGIGYRFYKERFSSKGGTGLPFIKALLNRFFDEITEGASFLEKIKLFIRKNLPDIYERDEDKTFEEVLDKEAKRLLNDAHFLKGIGQEKRNKKIFAVTSYLAGRMMYIYANKLIKVTSEMNLLDLTQALSAIGLVHLLVSPYYVAFYHQHRNKAVLKELKERFLPDERVEMPRKIALFTDTLHEINGVAITIKRLLKTAESQGIELTVITSTSEETSFKNGIMNFKSIGDIALPEYPEMRLHFPPVLDVIDYIEREGFTDIHASTPGSLGLLALFAAKLMDIPIDATYHTDIPQYVKSLTNDMFLENAAWNYMIWFYSQMDAVMVPSSSTRSQLIERGLPAQKTKPLPRWVDTEIFSPQKREPNIWKEYGLDRDIIKLLYVGRVSREKNMELLSDAFAALIDGGFRSHLVIVGDGPYRDEMEKRLKGYPALFTGFLSGEDLCRIYASSDIFLFPSATDTFGNVVLEAQASGLPVIVSDEGGPKELMAHGETGYVVKANSKESLTDAMIVFLKDKNRIKYMGKKARSFVEENTMKGSNAYSTILKTADQGELSSDRTGKAIYAY
jgi:glycosyltransferase involved in cell wall biosynthesis